LYNSPANCTQIHPVGQRVYSGPHGPPHTGAVVVVVVVGDAVVVVVVVVVVGACVVVVVVDVVVVVVVEPPQTIKELDNKYIVPPLVPVSPLDPVGNNPCDAVATVPTMYDAVTALLAVIDISANTGYPSG